MLGKVKYFAYSPFVLFYNWSFLGVWWVLLASSLCHYKTTNCLRFEPCHKAQL